MRSMSILKEMLEMFSTTLQAELNATLHVCESGLQDVPTNRSNFTPNVVFQLLYGVWLVGIRFPSKAPHRKKSGGLKSGDLGGRKAFEIIRSSKKLSISVMLSFEVWHVAPSC